MRTVLILVLLAVPLMPGLAQQRDEKLVVQETREVALGMYQQLAARLVAELKSGPPDAALAVCATVAEGMAARASAERGWRIARVSLKPRNPMFGGDNWEREALADFTARRVRGEDPDQMERVEIVTEPSGRFVRYIKALHMLPLCMECHGPYDTLKPEIGAALRREYPADRATDFRTGQIRGGLAVKRPF